MRRLLAIAVPAALLLGAPASAPAKGIMGASVCGADGCRQIPNADHRLLEGGAPADPPARPEPFVRVTVRIGVPDHVDALHLLFLPRSELVLADDGTTWTAPMARGSLQAIARRVRPFAAGELPAAVSRAGEGRAGAGDPLPPETVSAAAEPAPRAEAASGFDAWWVAVPAAAIVALALARRRQRRDRGARGVQPGRDQALTR